MPPFSTLRTYIQAVNTGQTNITRVLTRLMQYPAQWQGDIAQIKVDPLSPWLRSLFGAPGRMTPQEIDHIDRQWPDNQMLADEVVKAIEAGRPMVFKWTLTSQAAAQTDVVWPAADAPLTVPIVVTFRSPSSGVTYSADGEGNVNDVTVAV